MATKKKGGARKKAAKKSTARKSGVKKGARKKAAGKTARKAPAKSARKASAKSARKASAKSARKAAPKKAARKAAPKKKRAPNPAFMRPVQPDELLGAVVGTSPMPRTDITKKLWAYIRKNGLQDAKERRMINADEKLTKVFGGQKQVSMFEMTKLVSNHIN